ncbi:MAG: septum formation family protein [Propionicimonas sp.]
MPVAQPGPYPGTAAGVDKVSGLAVAALVAGALGSPLFSVIFGVLALKDIRQLKRSGRNLVYLGWALCAVWLAGIVVVTLAVSSGEPQRNPAGEVSSPGTLSPLAVRVGDCVKLPGLTPDVIEEVEVMPCDSPHDAELFSIVELDRTGSPDSEEMLDAAVDLCAAEIEEFLDGAEPTRALDVVAFIPDGRAWARGDHSSRCFLRDPAGDFVGSIRDR